MVDENTLVAGETGAGLFGVFKFFTGIKKFFKGITALGSLTSNGRIPYTDSDGNVNYVTPQQILDCVSTVNGNKSFTNDVSVGGALNVNGVSLDVILNQYVPKSDFGGNVFNVEYNGVEAPEGQENGNHFLIRVYNIHVFEYLNFFIGPLSNDYSAWAPPCTICCRIRDPSTTQWGDWKTLNSFLFR